MIETFLPAAFGLLGTIVGGSLTIWGQHRADRRDRERKQEAYYEEAAAELIVLIKERSMRLSRALGDRENAVELIRTIQSDSPMSDILMKVLQDFHELMGVFEAYAAVDLLLPEAVRELDEEDGKAARLELSKQLVRSNTPALAALTRIRHQLSTERPKRIDLDAALAAATEQSKSTKEFLERVG